MIIIHDMMLLLIKKYDMKIIFVMVYYKKYDNYSLYDVITD